jgi:hypothetical protein
LVHLVSLDPMRIRQGPRRRVPLGRRQTTARRRHANPWAADLYRKARGHDHPHTVRILAHAWIKIIWKCWTTNTAYDPHRHGALQPLIKQDQPVAA